MSYSVFLLSLKEANFIRLVVAVVNLGDLMQLSFAMMSFLVPGYPASIEPREYAGS